MSGDDCCCEVSPPEFGGRIPDRECPLHGESAPLMCPRCKGAGIVDTSPPGVENTAPWLQTDTDCPDCDGTGLLLESDEI